jgi:alkylation response protein AidB-like acyl-CoA dehydrogenase
MPDGRRRAFVASAQEILPLVRAEAAMAEACGRVSTRLLAALHERRLFRLWIPRSVGGEELALVPALEVFEAIASADGAAGWTVMIGAGAGLFGGFLAPAAAREILGPTDAVIAGSGSPSGVAVETDGGYRVTGRWSYASGARHATWFTANCAVQSADGRARKAAGGEPLIRAVAVPAAEVVIHETWAVTGLRGTGSEDFEIADRFVPSDRTFSALADSPREPGTLYRVPFFSIAELSFASVSLGLARLALDEFHLLAQTKRPAGSSLPLRHDPDVQSSYARAEAVVRASRSLVFDVAEAAWNEVERSRELSARTRADVRLAAVDAVQRCAAAIDLLHARAGMTPLFTASAFGRAWRDAHAVTQNMAVSAGLYAPVGAALLDA